MLGVEAPTIPSTYSWQGGAKKGCHYACSFLLPWWSTPYLYWEQWWVFRVAMHTRLFSFSLVLIYELCLRVHPMVDAAYMWWTGMDVLLEMLNGFATPKLQRDGALALCTLARKANALAPIDAAPLPPTPQVFSYILLFILDVACFKALGF